MPACKEVSLGMVSDDGKDLRPTDILVLNWENGQDVCMAVKGVSPFTGEHIRSFVPDKAISKAVLRKQAKNLEKYASLGYGLGVLAFSTLGELDYASISSSSSSSSLSTRTVTCDGAIRMDGYDFQREWSNGSQVVGSCNGVICICVSNYRFCLWNPSTCEHKLALCGRVLAGEGELRVRYGFGYDCHLDDYILLRIVANLTSRDYSQVEVYTLGSDSWKIIESINQYYFLSSNWSVWLLNGAFHWPGSIKSTSSKVIVSFNISNQRFVDFLYPKEVTNHKFDHLGLLEDRLCLVVYDDYYNKNLRLMSG
ncbi:F-box/kelch-repeat protein At3g06240-like [Papaver somniferum]|uniref:F-box/kelch-repeat protein At3g06240-like n=1 Tax=Papaver somniferum TaxID=3469 RepID=UPI000E6F7059|nr:F-box/kelch-repeat protein At3g06240-like [Papaver somniferum]